jgi:hypothetical protein
MHQTAEVTGKAYVSGCCQAGIDPASFSDGRRFLVCSACGKVLAVEAKAEAQRRTA